MRPKIDHYWVGRVKDIIANPPKQTAKQIEITLKHEASALGREDWPRERTIRRIKKDFDNEPEEAQREYRAFHWPATMEAGLLPWEASRFALDLLRNARQRGWPRPSVATVRWNWRLSLVSPRFNPEEPGSFNLEEREAWVTNIMATLASGTDLKDTRLDWILAFEPWKSELHAAMYNDAFPERPPWNLEKEEVDDARKE